MPVKNYDDFLIESLKDPEEAIAYLNAALEDTEYPEVFLIALRDVSKAWGGLSNLSKTTDLNRQNLYNLLSKDGNPRWSSMIKILNALNLRFTTVKA